MKKILKFSFILALPLLATFGIYHYYESLPIRGAYETGPISYPSVDKVALRAKLSQYSQTDLYEMYTAGLEALKWQDLLGKVHATVVSDIIKNFDHFYISDRYPHDQVYDAESESTYFYHSHRANEHGHFHIYCSDKKILSKFEAIASWDNKHSTTHLVSVSMHPDGEPIALFVPNHWVTKDDWYRHEDMKEMLSQFEINHPYPSWPSNQWVGQILKLFRPQIEQVLEERDEFVFNSEKPFEKVIKNRRIDELASIPISIADQMAVIEELLDKSTS